MHQGVGRCTGYTLQGVGRCTGYTLQGVGRCTGYTLQGVERCTLQIMQVCGMFKAVKNERFYYFSQLTGTTGEMQCVWEWHIIQHINTNGKMAKCQIIL